MEIFVCPVCRKQFDGITEFSTHISDAGHVDNPEDGRKYKNILMLTGHGHFEIYMTKVMSQLLWELALADLAKSLVLEV